MILTKKKRLLYLALWMAFLSLIYWGLGNTSLAMPVVFSFGFLCLVLSVLYVLVNGGIRPIVEEDHRREEKVHQKYLKDKGALHPIKRRDKYRRFRVKKEEENSVKEEEPPSPKPNPLKIPEEKRILFSQLLLVLVIPFYLIFFLDWLIVTIFF